MNEQQMSEVTSQLILAHAATVESKASLDRIHQVMSKEIPDATLTDALMSEAMRQQYLELAGREAIWSKKYGPNHLATGGLMAAFGVAAGREASDRVFRTGAQVENALHVNCIAMLPILKPVAPDPADKNLDAAGLVERRCIRRSAKLLRHVVDEPFSQFTELLRSLKVMADLNNVVGVNKVIGVTSSLPNEGQSTIAANFASMIAHTGSRVILVDGDLRNPSLSQNLAPGAAVGLVEVAAGRKAFNDTVWTDFETGLTFLPVGPESAKLLHPNEVLASIAVKSLIEKLRAEFDYVIVDFPLAPVLDTRTITSLIDSYVYVIEWGRTKIDVVEHSLSAAREVYDRLLGVVLNKANMSVLQRYGAISSYLLLSEI